MKKKAKAKIRREIRTEDNRLLAKTCYFTTLNIALIAIPKTFIPIVGLGLSLLWLTISIQSALIIKCLTDQYLKGKIIVHDRTIYSVINRFSILRTTPVLGMYIPMFFLCYWICIHFHK